MQDELEPIINDMIDEGGPVWHPTEHDESDDLEDAKVIEDEYRKLKDIDMDYSGAFESDVE